jgi:hypothetical protein
MERIEKIKNTNQGKKEKLSSIRS